MTETYRAKSITPVNLNETVECEQVSRKICVTPFPSFSPSPSPSPPIPTSLQQTTTGLVRDSSSLMVPDAGSRCYRLNCGKCGENLECYINTGDVADDSLVSSVISDSSSSSAFCLAELDTPSKCRTPCGQELNAGVETLIFTGEDWPGCPETIVGTHTDKCKGGAGDSNGLTNPSYLSNFASYTICLGDSNTKGYFESLSCSGPKCDSGTCNCQTNV